MTEVAKPPAPKRPPNKPVIRKPPPLKPGPPKPEPKPKVCRTADEAFQAGWDAAANHPPLTPAQITRLVALHRPYLSGLLSA